ncbi:hypothetical protein [Paenibacillus humicola]|uniref:hypothetical protein n=1 Tax=Paenibacillus humicola TaxID=3110540 RepID=UPI00237BCD8C|nr:hypothetical protein [Paenibacillus humicola]
MLEGYRAMICELLMQTYGDLTPRAKKGGRNFQIRQEALTFLDSSWFETLCAAVELDPGSVRRRMLQTSVSRRVKR